MHGNHVQIMHTDRTQIMQTLTVGINVCTLARQETNVLVRLYYHETGTAACSGRQVDRQAGRQVGRQIGKQT